MQLPGLSLGAKRKSEQTGPKRELEPDQSEGDLGELPPDKPGQRWLDNGGGGE
jgi:hypothetical protein